MKDIRCVICTKNINLDKDSYFKAELYLNGKLFGVDYSHKVCWNQRNEMNLKLNRLVSGVTDFAVKDGIMPEQEI